jgi:hypothetical protein
MQATLENTRKTTTKSPRSALKRKNIIEENGASQSRVKKKNKKTQRQGLKR